MPKPPWTRHSHMNRTAHSLQPDISSDPFKERSRNTRTLRIQILGAQFHFESTSQELLILVAAAYAGLPRHALGRPLTKMHVRLELASSVRMGAHDAPSPLALISGAGLLCGATDRSSFVVVSPAARSALVLVPREMLNYPYHARYELIEFAVFTLAQRVQRLVPLHAACVGHAGRGLLLMGGSGAGKSTLALHSLLHGLDFVSEDSTFVTCDTLRATGVANFLHVRADSLDYLGRGADAASIRKSPIIQRRSGIAKFEFDLRHTRHRLAAAPLKLRVLIFISKDRVTTRPLLAPLTRSRVLRYLTASQPYAASLPEWPKFEERAAKLPAFELRRGRHPQEAVIELQALVGMRAH
jgi:hypothetical protein